MKRSNFLSRTLALASVLLLTACGSEGPNDEPDTSADVGTDATADSSSDAETDSDSTSCEGEEGCACLDDGTCDEDLVCSDANVCESAEEPCTPGTTSCECLGDGTCSDASDECSPENLCEPRTTCVGELACACDAGETCEDGLECADGYCTSETSVLVVLTGGDARACDVLVDTPDHMASDVQHPAGVRGQYRARGARTAMAIIRTADSKLEGAAAAIIFDSAVSAGDVGAISATCYDRTGQTLGDVVPTVQ